MIQNLKSREDTNKTMFQKFKSQNTSLTREISIDKHTVSKESIE